MGKLFSKNKILAQEINGTDDFCEANKITPYCQQLLSYTFYGQATLEGEKCTDRAIPNKGNTLGLYLSMLDQQIRKYNPKHFDGKDDKYKHLLKSCAEKRKRDDESTDQCFERLLKDNKRFLKIYKRRGTSSLRCSHKEYWGSKQQLLAAKVVCDWIDIKHGSIDIIYGVLLNPPGGRVGPGDTGWIHNVLFDDTGYMAYHSAVHDSFGYLNTFHNVGPGYDYLTNKSLATDNCMAGQISGIRFWKKILIEVDNKLTVINKLKV